MTGERVLGRVPASFSIAMREKMSRICLSGVLINARNSSTAEIPDAFSLNPFPGKPSKKLLMTFSLSRDIV